MAEFVLNKAHLYEQVADELEKEIMSLYRGGGRLPSEQELAEKFQVSRSIIRESMKLLKERGLIDSRAGSGAYMTKPEAANLASTMSRIIKLNNEIDYNAIYDVRILLEVEAARQSAQRATAEQLAAMQACLDRLKDRTITVEQRRDSDFAFHYQIAVASGNPLLAMLVETMSYVFKEMIKTGIFIVGGIDDAIVRHERIMAALLARDPAGSEAAMRGHLEKSRQNVAEYQNAKCAR